MFESVQARPYSNFLDYELVRIAAKTDRLAAGPPSAFLREISNVKVSISTEH
ncbi:hypothetical protein ACU8OR_33710 (plasmid) [Rhizobium leguminosarum]